MTVEVLAPNTSTEASSDREVLTFSGKVALISGGNRPDGIGAATARELASQGAAAVVITSRDTPESKIGADQVVAELADLGTEPLWLAGDLTDPEVPAALIKETVAQCGGVDVLVNNAGITLDNLALIMKQEQWDRVLDTNLTAAFLMSQQAVRRSMRRNGGAIVNVSSIAGEYGNFGQANYSAAKAGLVGLTRQSAVEFAQYGVRVNAVSSGFVRTSLTKDMDPNLVTMVEHATPLGRLTTPEDVASAIAFLASPRAEMITGQVIPVDGGLDGGIRALPGLVKAGYQIPQEG